MNKRMVLVALFALLLYTPCLAMAAGPKDLTASLALLPGLTDGPDKGPFPELVKALQEYTRGKIKIETYPYVRSLDNVIKGRADFHIPSVRNPNIPHDPSLPWRFATEKVGQAAFVIYSNTAKPVTRKMIIDAVAKGGKFPYTIELVPGIEATFACPGIPSVDLPSSLQKVDKKRLDALIWAQEEADNVLRSLKLKGIHRELYQVYDDHPIVAKGPHGDEVDKILTSAIREFRASGKLKQYYIKVHQPYEEWQPANMN